MDPVDESKSCQLRVRVTPEERDLLENLRAGRARGETISDLVREGISRLVRGGNGTGEDSARLGPHAQGQLQRLADLLKREPRQVEEACVEGIMDLIESKCEVPLIVMETHLHMKYRNGSEKQEFTWSPQEEVVAGAPAPKSEV